MSRFKLFKEKKGIISYNSIWVFIDNQGYLYTHENIFKLALILFKEWKSDRHLVG